MVAYYKYKICFTIIHITTTYFMICIQVSYIPLFIDTTNHYVFSFLRHTFILHDDNNGDER